VPEAGPVDPETLPTGRELSRQWSELSRPVQSELFRRIRRAEPGRDAHEATLIAAMARQRLRSWTMRPEIILPAFVGFFALLSLVVDNFSFESALSAPIAYALYLFWMRSMYKRAYRHNIDFLEGRPPADE
jgi:hypothetical protein